MICSFFVSAALKPSMKGGMEGRGMGAVVYLISIVGNIPRDLHFHLITATTELMTAAQWNRFLLPCQIFKKKKKKSRLRKTNNFAQHHRTDKWRRWNSNQMEGGRGMKLGIYFTSFLHVGVSNADCFSGPSGTYQALSPRFIFVFPHHAAHGRT